MATVTFPLIFLLSYSWFISRRFQLLRLVLNDSMINEKWIENARVLA